MSRTTTYIETITLQESVCASCGILFAAPAHFLKEKQRDKGTFYCPNGHSLHYTTTEADNLRKRLDDEQKKSLHYETQLISVRDQLKASQRELERHKKRAANGVCPCCHRTFAQVQRHMKSQHPEHVAQANK